MRSFPATLLRRYRSGWSAESTVIYAGIVCCGAAIVLVLTVAIAAAV